MRERITFSGAKSVPFAETQNKLDSIHALKQQVDMELSLTTEVVELNVNFSPPFVKIPISDLHLFSVISDTSKADYLFRRLEDENTYGVIMGDVVEGASPGIMDHMGNLELPFGQQIRAARKRLAPYIEAGKILCMQTGFNGHEGWGMRYLGIDVVELMAEGFVQPDGTPLQVLNNGGRLIIHFSNGESWSELNYHAPGGGGSDEINPVGAQRERLREYASHRAAKEGWMDGVGGGDWHHRSAVAKELILDLNNARERTRVLYSNGTIKGNDPRRTDGFLTRMAKGPTTPPGVQLILNQSERKGNERKNGERAWVSYGFDKGEILYDSAKIWEATERQRNTHGLLEEIVERNSAPKAEFDRPNSRTKVKERRNEIPVFEKFNWKVESSNDLPMLIYLLQNTRYGSTSFYKRDRERFLEIINHASKNPYEYVVAMRHFVDPEEDKEFYREHTIENLINDLHPLVEQGNSRLLGFMLSSSLLTERWEKEVLGDRIEVPDDSKRGYHWEIERNPGIRPGDVIYIGLDRKVPLYLNQSLMNLRYGPTNYKFLFLDHLSHSGSEFDMFRGLVQARRKAELSDVDIVAGGHMLGAGFLVTPDATYISPGWFSDYDSRGKANMRRAPLGGQGIILLPNTKMVIPASTFLEAKDIHGALMLHKGLTVQEKEKLLFKTRR